MNDLTVLEKYDEGKSTYEIAQLLNTYPNKVRRILIKYGKVLRNKSEAQSKALESGRSKHPTEGKNRPESVKIKISEALAKKWQDISPEERQKRVDSAKERWNEISEEKKEEFRKLAAEAVREASKNGSKLEKFLLLELSRKGYRSEFHRKNVVVNEDLEVDILLPDCGVAIEVDGPAHFFPIWGEESLEKHLKADFEKNGLLINAGFKVIRIKHLVKSISENHKRQVLTKVISVLECIKDGSLQEKLIEIEVK